MTVKVLLLDNTNQPIRGGQPIEVSRVPIAGESIAELLASESPATSPRGYIVISVTHIFGKAAENVVAEVIVDEEK
jgi:hypothetical protein